MKAVAATSTRQENTSTSSVAFSGVDSVTTNSRGYYSFESLTVGTYNIEGNWKNGSLVVLTGSITYDSAGVVTSVPILARRRCAEKYLVD